MNRARLPPPQRPSLGEPHYFAVTGVALRLFQFDDRRSRRHGAVRRVDGEFPGTILTLGAAEDAEPYWIADYAEARPEFRAAVEREVRRVLTRGRTDDSGIAAPPLDHRPALPEAGRHQKGDRIVNEQHNGADPDEPPASGADRRAEPFPRNGSAFDIAIWQVRHTANGRRRRRRGEGGRRRSGGECWRTRADAGGA